MKLLCQKILLSQKNGFEGIGWGEVFSSLVSCLKVVLALTEFSVRELSLFYPIKSDILYPVVCKWSRFVWRCDENRSNKSV